MSSVLVALNVIALNLWLAPVHRLRVDLTENDEFTLSPVTAGLIASLDEPLRIRAFFSEKTHPLLAPLVPQIRDQLAEYEVRGKGRVTVDIADPNQDEALEAELNEQYSVRPVPFGVSDRHSQSVVNAYFHIVLAYGDGFEVLDFSDLVEVRSEQSGVTVKLKNFEYDLTRAIKKVSQDFQTLESLLARIPEGSKVTLSHTPGAAPADFAPTAAAMKKVGEEFARAGLGRLAFAEIDPSGDPELQTQLYEKYGVQPLAADLFATQRFYMHLVVEVGDQVERILPRGELTEADLRTALEAAIRRGTPGQLRKVLLVTEEPVQPPPNPELPPQMQPPPKRPDYQGLEELLGENYEIARTELREGDVPDDVDVLVLAKPGSLDDRQQYALDQYLMRGGTIVALAGRYRIEPARQSLAAKQEAAPVFDLLERWGVTVRDALVMGDDVASFPLPVQQRLGGMTLQRIELVPYPFFPDLRGESLNDDHAALSAIHSVTMPWSSPLLVTEPLDGRNVTWLVRTGPLASVRDGGKIDPDSVSSAGPTWTPGTEAGVQTLGTLIVGRFPSAFAQRPNPNDEGATGPDTSGRTLDKSIADGRLVVLGSSELVSDIMLALAQQTQAQEHAGNLQLMFNLVDWATEDTDLLSIRTAGAFARTLRPLEDAERTAIEVRTWGAIFLPVVVVLGLVRFRRRNVQPLPLAPVEST
jgi:ABC-2 type transport system permease protein